MIITKEVVVNWHVRTVEYYKTKGYIFTNYGDSFTVNVEDLPLGSRAKISVSCDYCKTEYEKPYFRVLEILNKSIISKISCIECSHLKIAEEKDEKQRRGLIEKGENGYWKYKENREKGFHDFIAKYGSIDNLSELDSGLYCAFKKYEEGSLEQVMTRLGYKWRDIASTSPIKYYWDFNNLETTIRVFIREHGRFPKTIELTKTLSIQNESIQHHGGIDSIKDKMNYSDKNDLIDGLGFRNKSLLEYHVAQFLIKNSIPYLREIAPFNGERFRSDFLIKTTDDCLFFVEVWGYDKKGHSDRSKNYNRKRKIKEALYKKNKFNLISVEYDEMERMNVDEIQGYLINKFKVLSQYNLERINNKDFLHPYWNSETIYKTFLDIVRNNKQPINKETLKSADALAILEVLPKIYSSYSLVPAKVEFYHKYFNTDSLPKFIDNNEVLLLERVSKQTGYVTRYIKSKHIEMANEILNKIHLQKEMVSNA